MHDYVKNPAKVVRAAREEAHLSQAALAEQIGCDSGSFLFVAISKSYSCNISIITQVRFQVNMFFLKLTTT